MYTLAKIRNDLKEIRYFYQHKGEFDKAVEGVVENSIFEKVRTRGLGGLVQHQPRLARLSSA
jgi:hypothetical protein